MKVARFMPAACCALLAPAAFGIEQQTAQPALNAEQQRAAGIVVAHPLAAKAPQRIEALGTVLDAAALSADLGDSAAADAAQRSAAAETARLRALYQGGAGASLKMLEAAQTEQAKAQAQAQVAAARFAQRWGPVAAMPQDARRRLIEAAIRGRTLLVRADLPGRHSLGSLPAKAVLDVDGILVPGRVLGILRQAGNLQGVGLLIEVSSAPSGLSADARMPVALIDSERAGMLLPRDALLYDENGAYVYKQLTQKKAADPARFAPVKVTLLAPYGDGWLVSGVDDDDDIVVRGAGVLWSLQGVDAHAADDDDDD